MTMAGSFSALCSLAFLLSCGSIQAQGSPAIREIRFYERTDSPSADVAPKPRLVIPKTDKNPSKLGDDPAFWQNAVVSDDFVAMGDSRARSNTRSCFLTDEKTLYIAVDCYEDQWDKLVTKVAASKGDARRAWTDDCLEIFIDGNMDQRSYHWIVITAAGAKEDAEASAPDRLNYKWNGKYEYVVRKFPDKWRVELAIPHTELGWTEPPSGAFGLNVVRHKLTPPGGYTALSPTYGPNHVPHRFAEMKMAGRGLSFTGVSSGKPRFGQNELRFNFANLANQPKQVRAIIEIQGRQTEQRVELEPNSEMTVKVPYHNTIFDENVHIMWSAEEVINTGQTRPIRSGKVSIDPVGQLGEVIMFKDEYLGDEVVATGHMRFNVTRATMADCLLKLDVVDTKTGEIVTSRDVEGPDHRHAFFEIDITNLKAGSYEVRARLSQDAASVGALTTKFLRSREMPRADVTESSVDLIIDDAVNRKKSTVPVTVGVPMPRGILRDVGKVRVVDRAGKPAPHQSRVLGRWTKEGSVKWLGLDFLASPEPGVKTSYTLEFGNHISHKKGQPLAREHNDEIILQNGVLKLIVSRATSYLIDSVSLDGREVAKQIDGLIQNNRDEVFRGSLDPLPSKISIEENGPFKCVIRKETKYGNDEGGTSCSQVVRLTVYKDQPYLQITHTFIFTEDSNEIQMSDIAIEVPLTIGKAKSVRFDISPEHDGQILTINEIDPGKPLSIHQAEAIRYGEGQNRYAVYKGNEQIRTGELAGHWFEVSDGDRSVVAAVRNLWQQFPKELEFVPGNNQTMRIHLWSGRGDYPLDFRTKSWVERRGTWGAEYERHWNTHENQAFGVAKTHEVFLYFYPPKIITAEAVETTAATFEHPVLAYADPKWMTTSEVFGKFHYVDRENFPREEEMIERVILNIDKNFSQGVDTGFIDYGLVPRMEVIGVKGIKKRLPSKYRFNADYGFTQYLWRAFARDPRRDYFNLVTRTSHFRHDIGMCHATGLGKHAGEFNYWGFPWPPPGQTLVGRMFMFHINFAILEYYLRGYNRAEEVARINGDRMKERWDFDGWPETDSNIDSGRRSRFACIRECIDLYQLTWDDSFLLMAREMFEAMARPNEPGGLRPATVFAGSEEMDPVIPIYSKHEYATFDFMEYEQFTHTDLAQRTLQQTVDYYYHIYGYTMPFDNNGWWWNMPFAYWMTKDPKYAVYVRRMNELLIDYVDHHKNEPHNIWKYNAAANSVVSGVGYIESVLTDSKDVARGFPYYGHGTEFYLQPGDEKTLKIEIHGHQPRFHEADFLPTFYRGSGEKIPDERVRFKPYSNKGYAYQYHWIEVDLLEGDNVIRMQYPRKRGTTIKRTNARKVVVGIEGGEFLSRYKSGHYYFMVPDETKSFVLMSDNPRQFQIIRPNGETIQFSQTPKRNRIEVDPGEDGRIWKLEHLAVEHDGNFVRLAGVPEAISFFDPELLFVPSSLANVRPTRETPRPGEPYVQGVSGTIDDMALNLLAGRSFHFPTGKKLADMQFEHLDLNQGTIEFWFKPSVSSFEADAGWAPWFSSSGKSTGLLLNARSERGRTCFGTHWKTKGDHEWRDYLFVPLRAGRWYHYALQWEHRRNLLFYDVYIDGEKMQVSGGDPLDVQRHGPAMLGDPGERLYIFSAPDSPADRRVRAGRVFPALLDELRTSNVKRYAGNLIHPEKRLVVDDHTLAMFHFNGDTEGKGRANKIVQGFYEVSPE